MSSFKYKKVKDYKVEVRTKNNVTIASIERDGSVVTGFVVTDKYGNVGIIDKGAVRWIDKAKFHNMMHNEIEFNGDDLVKSVESFAKTI